MTTTPPASEGIAGPSADEIALLPQAACDCRYLLARGYPRAATLTLVGNRYQLSQAGRQILHRGVFPPALAQARRQKLVALSRLRGQSLAVDGHNVVITLESALRGLPVVAADDGFIRDIGRLSRAYRPSPLTTAVLRSLAAYLAEHGLEPIRVYYDAPMSRSGELAAHTRAVFSACGLNAEVQAVPVPEKMLLAASGPVASSDTHLIDRCAPMTDPAGEIIRQRPDINLISLGFCGERT